MFHDPQVILFSTDVDRSADFYAGLGFVETFRVPEEGAPIHVDLVLDGYKIGVASVESTRVDHGLEPVTQGQRAAVILWTDDTHAAFARLVELGVADLHLAAVVRLHREHPERARAVGVERVGERREVAE